MTTLTEHRLCLPLRAALAGRDSRDVVLLEGPAGWGEWSPLPGYPSDPAVCRRAAEEAANTEWPPARRSQVEVNALVPGVAPEEAAALATAAVVRGFRTIKVKMGDVDGLDRVAAVRDAAGPHVRIRVDANGAWDVDSAATILARMARYHLELAEQPVASLEDLAALRRRIDLPLAADEAVRDLADARRLHDLAAADALVLKVQPVGGVAAALDIAEAAGVPIIVTSMYETSVGLAAGLALAAALDDLPYACGLGTAELFEADVVADPLVPVAGVLDVRRPVPDAVRIARYEVGG